MVIIGTQKNAGKKLKKILTESHDGVQLGIRLGKVNVVRNGLA